MFNLFKRTSAYWFGFRSMGSVTASNLPANCNSIGRSTAVVPAKTSRLTAGQIIRQKFRETDVDPGRMNPDMDDAQEYGDDASHANEVRKIEKSYKEESNECVVDISPIKLWKYNPEKCCVDYGPRRKRKSVGVKGCSGGGSAVDDDLTTCDPITCIGCKPARKPTACFDVRPPEYCERILPPTLCFHDCMKDSPPELPPNQCDCHADKQPPCIPTPKPPRGLADR